MILASGATLTVYSLKTEKFDLFREIGQVQVPKALHHPVSLSELMILGYDRTVATIFTALEKETRKTQFSLLLGIPLAELLKEETIERGFSTVKLTIALTDNEPALDAEYLKLLIECFNTFKSQERVFDPFLRTIYLRAKELEFSLTKHLKTLCLSTMEVAWALHSDQQDTLLQLLFNHDMEWGQLRAFGIGI